MTVFPVTQAKLAIPLGNKVAGFWIVKSFYKIFLIFLIAITSQTSTTSTPSTCQGAYSIVAGDNCFSIWNYFNMTEAEFFAINPNINCNKTILILMEKLINYFYYF